MNKQERAQMYMSYLQGEGYSPKIDSDGDVFFKFEGRNYYIMIDDRDDEFFRLVFPNFWSIESEAERVKVDRAALAVTTETKVAKVYPLRDNVWASIEIFCSPPEGFKTILKRSLSALEVAASKFAEKMRD